MISARLISLPFSRCGIPARLPARPCGAADRNTRPRRLSLNSQSAGTFGRQCFVRPACNDGPIPLDELRHFRLPPRPCHPAQHGVLALGDLAAECGRSPRRSGKHHQAGHPVRAPRLQRHPAGSTAATRAAGTPSRWKVRRASSTHKNGIFIVGIFTACHSAIRDLRLQDTSRGLAVPDLAAHDHLISFIPAAHGQGVRNSSTSRCIWVLCRPVATHV